MNCDFHVIPYLDLSRIFLRVNVKIPASQKSGQNYKTLIFSHGFSSGHQRQVAPMELAMRVASSVIHRGLASFVNWTAVNMSAITAAAFTSRPSSVLQA
jgi:hypothetical protein